MHNHLKVFVYGTLKKGGILTNSFIDQSRVYCEDAFITGYDMYDMTYFPAVVPGNAAVKGELHHFKDGEKVIDIMDRIEGYMKDDPEYSLFVRKTVTVDTERGKTKAFIYLFNGKPEGKLIKEGEWNGNQ